MSGGFERKPGGESLIPGIDSNASTPGSAGKWTLTQQVALHHGSDTPGLIVGKAVDDGQVPFSNQVDGTDISTVQRIAARGIADGSGSLPHGPTIQRLFGRHDISGINAHVGGAAGTASRAIGAEAYAVGNHVAFASMPSLHTAVHEAAHIIQQRSGVQSMTGGGAAGDPLEQHADAVADRVVAGSPAEELLDAYSLNSSAAPAGANLVQRKPASAPAAQVNEDHSAHLIQLLSSVSPGTGGDPALAYLDTLATPALLATLSDAVDRGYAQQLHARLAAARPLLVAALYAAELARIAPTPANHPLLQRAGAALDLVSRKQQLQILSFLLHCRGVSIEATTLVEGVLAICDGRDHANAEASNEQLPDGAGRGAADSVPAGAESAAGPVIGASITGGAAPPAPISPTPWTPPGNQPGGLYVGNEAHTAIGAAYRAAHPGDQTYLNTTPLSTILTSLTSMATKSRLDSVLTDDELARRPDIANLTRRHLYEIKPAAAQVEAAAKARLYITIFGKAGLQMVLGPTGEPGTYGGLPAPAGVFMFQSPEPGVITYEYRKGRLRPVPVAQPEPTRERRWRWELQPLTQTQKQAVTTTTVGGAILIMLMIVLAPVGA